MDVLHDKTILLGITGGISAYKSADIASKLRQCGVNVDVVMTESAEKFITSLTMQSVTGRKVYTDMWEPVSSIKAPTHSFVRSRRFDIDSSSATAQYHCKNWHTGWRTTCSARLFWQAKPR
jgi:3-polyprenyl-4-hydroxybenzoate decarboxylase